MEKLLIDLKGATIIAGANRVKPCLCSLRCLKLNGAKIPSPLMVLDRY